MAIRPNAKPIRRVWYAASPTSSALKRRERAENLKKRNYFATYGDKARAVLEALLEKYANEGIETIEFLCESRPFPVVHMETTWHRRKVLQQK